MAKRDAMLEAALAYAREGFLVFPMKGKQPLTPHGFKDATMDEATIRGFWRRHPNANIGIATGEKSGLVVLDCDSAEGEAALLAICGGELPRTRTHITGRGRHYLFGHPGVAVRSTAPFRPGLDIRADGACIVAPPSVHPDTGRCYEVVDPTAPIAPLPPALLVALTTKERDRAAASESQIDSEAEVTEGGRNSFLTQTAGRLRGTCALDIEALRYLLHFYNARKCNPPLDDAEVDRIAKSAEGWSRGQTVVAELNQTYGVVQTGGKVRVLQEQADGDFTLLPAHEFRLLLSNQLATALDGKRRSVADIWLASVHRRQFDGIVFEPGPKRTSRTFNLFRGFSVEPIEGDCSLFLEHVTNNICQREAALARWVLAWLADIFQHPASKCGTALVLRGRQGTGKTILGDIIGHLLGVHHTAVATSERVTGRFNAHLERCLLLQAEEAFWAADKAAEGALKDLITSSRQYVERKGVDAIEVANHLRLLVTSNATWVVPAGLDERRFAVLDVGEERAQDKVYFGQMMAQMNAGGFEALLYHLLHLDISDVDLRTIPKTAALSEQKLATLSPELKWFVDILVEGVLPGDTDGTGVVRRAELHADYVRNAQKLGARRRASQTELGVLLNKYVPGLRRERPSRQLPSGITVRVATYVFPPLTVCRASFAAISGYSFKWQDRDETWRPADEARTAAEDNEF